MPHLVGGGKAVLKRLRSRSNTGAEFAHLILTGFTRVVPKRIGLIIIRGSFQGIFSTYLLHFFYGFRTLQDCYFDSNRMAEDVEMRVIPQAHQTSSGAPETAADGQIVAPRSPCSSVTAHEPVTTRLHHRYWPLAIFLIYAIFVVTSWTILCIVSWRPIIGPSSYDEGSRYKNGWDLEQTVKRIKVAQVLQTVAALLTIPVTSAICSAAFVAYMQAGSFRKTLTLRQLMALADQAWLRPQSVDTLSKIGSLPLYVAFGLTLIGKFKSHHIKGADL